MILRLLIVLSFIPASAHAQSLARWHAEANAGIYVPNTFGTGDQQMGWVLGGRAGYTIMHGARIVAQGSYAEVKDVQRIGTNTDFVRSGIRERLLIAGIDFPISRALRLELAVGGVWMQRFVTGIQGNPAPNMYPGRDGAEQSDWSASPAGVPAISYRFGRYITLRVRDLMILDDPTGRHNVSVMAGLGI